MKPTTTSAAQPQPVPANDPHQTNRPARASGHDAFPFATHDVLVAFAFIKSSREDK
jgi:hypothetical protein